MSKSEIRLELQKSRALDLHKYPCKQKSTIAAQKYFRYQVPKHRQADLALPAFSDVKDVFTRPLNSVESIGYNPIDGSILLYQKDEYFKQFIRPSKPSEQMVQLHENMHRAYLKELKQNTQQQSTFVTSPPLPKLSQTRKTSFGNDKQIQTEGLGKVKRPQKLFISTSSQQLPQVPSSYTDHLHTILIRQPILSKTPSLTQQFKPLMNKQELMRESYLQNYAPYRELLESQVVYLPQISSLKNFVERDLIKYFKKESENNYTTNNDEQ